MGVSVRPEDDIERAAHELGVVEGDPSYAFVMGMRRLIAEHSAEVRAELSEVRGLIEKAKLPIDERLQRQVLWDFIRTYGYHLIRLVNWKAWAVVGLALWLAFAAGYGVRYWTEDGLKFAGIRNDPDVCSRQPDGRTLCRIPIWLEKPSK